MRPTYDHNHSPILKLESNRPQMVAVKWLPERIKTCTVKWLPARIKTCTVKWLPARIKT